ncbi:MAG: HEAT repeat domain-containing protein [Phycisphaerae bacterium]|nr:HEAT repeat domain-containing protein [Phycisphaerae bacterium]
MTIGKEAAVWASTVGAGALAAQAGQTAAVQDLIKFITGEDETVRGKAWLNAHAVGPGAIAPLAALLSGQEQEVSRAARRAMWRIVRDAGRPGADALRQQAVGELLPLLADGQPRAVRYEVVWMLSELGGDECVAPLAKLLAAPDLREDARAALQRIPGDRSLAALRDALPAAPADYKPALAASLRARGVQVSDVPDAKLVPTKQTKVKPAQPE